MQFILILLFPIFVFATQKSPVYYSGDSNTLKFKGTKIIDETDTQIAPSTIDGLTPTTTKGDLLVEGTSALTRFPVCGQDLILSGSSATATGWDCAANSGGINNVSEDLSPELGGNLGLNSKDITGTGNINITGNITNDGVLTVISGASTIISTNSSQVTYGIGVIREYTNANGDQWEDCDWPTQGRTAKTSSFTLTAADHCAGFTDSGGNSIVVTFPSYSVASNIGLRAWFCKKSNTGNSFDVTADSSEKVNSNASATITVVEDIGCAKCQIIDDGSDWGVFCDGVDQ